MKKATYLAVLFWWFVMLTKVNQPVQIGPFNTQGDCDKVRAALVLLDEANKVTECWECSIYNKYLQDYYILPDLRLNRMD